MLLVPDKRGLVPLQSKEGLLVLAKRGLVPLQSKEGSLVLAKKGPVLLQSTYVIQIKPQGTKSLTKLDAY